MPLPSSPRARWRKDPFARRLAGAALLVALMAVVFAMAGISTAGQQDARHAARATPAGASLKPKPYGLLRLGKTKKFPASAIPKVAAAKRADRLGGATRQQLALKCSAETVDLGSWCLDSSTYSVPLADIGKNDYFYATSACVERGGFLPTAAQLIGTASRVKLSSTIDDNATTAAVDEEPGDGVKDMREMSSTLVTTTAGSSSAGSQGTTPGSKGDPAQGEPDPIPQPADPSPSTLQYVTVYDNHDKGGFAGGQPVGSAQRFRCAFEKVQGRTVGDEG